MKGMRGYKNPQHPLRIFMKGPLSIHIREQGQVAGSFDRDREASLVVGTEAGFAPRIDLGLRAHKLADGLRVLIIHDIAVGGAEKALFGK